MHRKKITARVALALGSALSAYLVVDLALGFFLIHPQSPRVEVDPVVHHRLEPGTSRRIRAADFDYVHRVNRAGLRGPEIPLDRRPETFRVVMLGDSFTMGKGVVQDQTFSARLDQALEGWTVEGRPVEVLNAGVDSYSPILSYLQMSRQYAWLEPDLVVLNLDMSDLVQEQAYRRAARFGPGGELVGVEGRETRGAGIRARLRRLVDRRLFVSRLLADRLFGPSADELTFRATVSRANRRLLDHTLRWDKHDRDAQWADLFDSVRRLAGYCADHDIDFLLTVYPWGHQVSADEWRPGRDAFLHPEAPVDDRSLRRIEEFSRGHGIELLDVFPAFRAYSGDERLYFRHDMHWTPAGHALMAAELERALRRRYRPSRAAPASPGSAR